MICAAQEQTFRSDSIKFSIDRTVNSPLAENAVDPWKFSAYRNIFEIFDNFGAL